MPMSVFGRKDDSLYDWENRFAALREKASDVTAKRQYDTARAALKYASACGASLARRQSSNDGIIFDLAFDKEQACYYLEHMDSCIEGAIMV